MSRRKSTLPQTELNTVYQSKPPTVVFHPHKVEVITRSEGYREFRCIPATWTYPDEQPYSALLTEFYSQLVNVNPDGEHVDSEFWSGSDAALRLRALPTEDMAMREMAALASRRTVGMNAPKPWASWSKVKDMALGWQPEATEIHFMHHPRDEKIISLWEHYGMEKSWGAPVIFGRGMRESNRPPIGNAGAVWKGAPGTWYSWATLLGWERWPRRQDSQHLSAAAEPGKLLLFVSHRWESLDHPDPNGSQLLCLKVGLTLALAAAILRLHSRKKNKDPTFSGLPELIAEYIEDVFGRRKALALPLHQWARDVEAIAKHVKNEKAFRTKVRKLEALKVGPALDQIRSRILIWYDYASMFQTPRTPSEQAEFRREILDLNKIQQHAGTLVIAGDDQYLSRGWCFLELCGGIRGRIVELTPSWGTRVGVGHTVTAWGSRSDQLIGSLKAGGLGAIYHSGLEATHSEDLIDIARLLSELPLTGLIETDDSDLIGGTLPTPYRSGEWMIGLSAGALTPTEIHMFPSITNFGGIPDKETLHSTHDQYVNAESLDGPVGIWVYTTQRILTLAWAARAKDLWKMLRREIAQIDASKINDSLLRIKKTSVACMWADSRSLTDDGFGWTRVIPSTAEVLVIITQSDIPELCFIYDWVVCSHVACGVPVITYAPETGRTLIYLPDKAKPVQAHPRRADVLVVPRIRRTDLRATRLFLPPNTKQTDVEVLAALRLNPDYGFVLPGRISEEVAAQGIGNAGDEITAMSLLAHSEARVRTEGLARSTAAIWDEWCMPRLHQGNWQTGLAPSQLHIIEQLVLMAFIFSDNPFIRRQLLSIIVEDEQFANYALPSWILQEAEIFIKELLDEAKRALKKGAKQPKSRLI